VIRPESVSGGCGDPADARDARRPPHFDHASSDATGSPGAAIEPIEQNDPVSVETMIEEMETLLGAAGTADRAEAERRYLKSDLQHLGVPVPEIRKIVKQALKDAGELSHDQLVGLVEGLWRRPVHEIRMAAVEVVNARPHDLRPGDITLVEHMLRTAKTWALLDGLAVSGARCVLTGHPDEEAILDRWAHDDDFWIRRSALLVHLGPLRNGSGNWERFCRYADGMLDEKELFIRKAIGWVLRDTARLRPDMVYAWILPRARRASGVTIREVVKRLTPEQAEEVMGAYRRR
jgi:3-methyladenine DNA glycosylase AlkD